MKKINMEVVSCEKIALDTIEMILKDKYISQTAIPGQFLHIQVVGHTLRRPISIAHVNQELGMVTIIFKTIGSGTKKLATYKPGSLINVLGPNGNGFEALNNSNEKVLLIGGGVGVPPLHFLGKSLSKQGVTVVSILGFQAASHVFYEEESLL